MKNKKILFGVLGALVAVGCIGIVAGILVSKSKKVETKPEPEKPVVPEEKPKPVVPEEKPKPVVPEKIPTFTSGVFPEIALDSFASQTPEGLVAKVEVAGLSSLIAKNASLVYQVDGEKTNVKKFDFTIEKPLQALTLTEGLQTDKTYQVKLIVDGKDTGFSTKFSTANLPIYSLSLVSKTATSATFKVDGSFNLDDVYLYVKQKNSLAGKSYFLGTNQNPDLEYFYDLENKTVTVHNLNPQTDYQVSIRKGNLSALVDLVLVVDFSTENPEANLPYYNILNVSSSAVLVKVFNVSPNKYVSLKVKPVSGITKVDNLLTYTRQSNKQYLVGQDGSATIKVDNLEPDTNYQFDLFVFEKDEKAPKTAASAVTLQQNTDPTPETKTTPETESEKVVKPAKFQAISGSKIFKTLAPLAKNDLFNGQTNVVLEFKNVDLSNSNYVFKYRKQNQTEYQVLDSQSFVFSRDKILVYLENLEANSTYDYLFFQNDLLINVGVFSSKDLPSRSYAFENYGITEAKLSFENLESYIGTKITLKVQKINFEPEKSQVSDFVYNDSISLTSSIANFTLKNLTPNTLYQAVLLDAQNQEISSTKSKFATRKSLSYAVATNQNSATFFVNLEKLLVNDYKFYGSDDVQFFLRKKGDVTLSDENLDLTNLEQLKRSFPINQYFGQKIKLNDSVATLKINNLEPGFEYEYLILRRTSSSWVKDSQGFFITLPEIEKSIYDTNKNYGKLKTNAAGIETAKIDLKKEWKDVQTFDSISKISGSLKGLGDQDTLNLVEKVLAISVDPAKIALWNTKNLYLEYFPIPEKEVSTATQADKQDGYFLTATKAHFKTKLRVNFDSSGKILVKLSNLLPYAIYQFNLVSEEQDTNLLNAKQNAELSAAVSARNKQANVIWRWTTTQDDVFKKEQIGYGVTPPLTSSGNWIYLLGYEVQNPVAVKAHLAARISGYTSDDFSKNKIKIKIKITRLDPTEQKREISVPLVNPPTSPTGPKSSINNNLINFYNDTTVAKNGITARSTTKKQSASDLNITKQRELFYFSIDDLDPNYAYRFEIKDETGYGWVTDVFNKPMEARKVADELTVQDFINSELKTKVVVDEMGVSWTFTNVDEKLKGKKVLLALRLRSGTTDFIAIDKDQINGTGTNTSNRWVPAENRSKVELLKNNYDLRINASKGQILVEGLTIDIPWEQVIKYLFDRNPSGIGDGAAGTNIIKQQNKLPSLEKIADSLIDWALITKEDSSNKFYYLAGSDSQSPLRYNSNFSQGTGSFEFAGLSRYVVEKSNNRVQFEVFLPKNLDLPRTDLSQDPKPDTSLTGDGKIPATDNVFNSLAAAGTTSMSPQTPTSAASSVVTLQANEAVALDLSNQQASQTTGSGTPTLDSGKTVDNSVIKKVKSRLVLLSHEMPKDYSLFAKSQNFSTTFREWDYPPVSAWNYVSDVTVDKAWVFHFDSNNLKNMHFFAADKDYAFVIVDVKDLTTPLWVGYSKTVLDHQINAGINNAGFTISLSKVKQLLKNKDLSLGAKNISLILSEKSDFSEPIVIDKKNSGAFLYNFYEGTFNSFVTGLKENSVYYYKISVVNEEGKPEVEQNFVSGQFSTLVAPQVLVENRSSNAISLKVNNLTNYGREFYSGYDKLKLLPFFRIKKGETAAYGMPNQGDPNLIWNPNQSSILRVEYQEYKEGQTTQLTNPKVKYVKFGPQQNEVSFSIDNLDPNKNYSYRVFVVNPAFEGQVLVYNSTVFRKNADTDFRKRLGLWEGTYHAQMNALLQSDSFKNKSIATSDLDKIAKALVFKDEKGKSDTELVADLIVGKNLILNLTGFAKTKQDYQVSSTLISDVSVIAGVNSVDFSVPNALNDNLKVVLTKEGKEVPSVFVIQKFNVGSSNNKTFQIAGLVTDTTYNYEIYANNFKVAKGVIKTKKQISSSFEVIDSVSTRITFANTASYSTYPSLIQVKVYEKNKYLNGLQKQQDLVADFEKLVEIPASQDQVSTLFTNLKTNTEYVYEAFVLQYLPETKTKTKSTALAIGKNQMHLFSSQNIVNSNENSFKTLKPDLEVKKLEALNYHKTYVGNISSYDFKTITTLDELGLLDDNLTAFEDSVVKAIKKIKITYPSLALDSNKIENQWFTIVAKPQRNKNYFRFFDTSLQSFRESIEIENVRKSLEAQLKAKMEAYQSALKANANPKSVVSLQLSRENQDPGVENEDPFVVNPENPTSENETPSSVDQNGVVSTGKTAISGVNSLTNGGKSPVSATTVNALKSQIDDLRTRISILKQQLDSESSFLVYRPTVILNTQERNEKSQALILDLRIRKKGNAIQIAAPGYVLLPNVTKYAFSGEIDWKDVTSDVYKLNSNVLINPFANQITYPNMISLLANVNRTNLTNPVSETDISTLKTSLGQTNYSLFTKFPSYGISGLDFVSQVFKSSKSQQGNDSQVFSLSSDFVSGLKAPLIEPGKIGQNNAYNLQSQIELNKIRPFESLKTNTEGLGFYLSSKNKHNPFENGFFLTKDLVGDKPFGIDNSFAFEQKLKALVSNGKYSFLGKSLSEQNILYQSNPNKLKVFVLENNDSQTSSGIKFNLMFRDGKNVFGFNLVIRKVALGNKIAYQMSYLELPWFRKLRKNESFGQLSWQSFLVGANKIQFAKDQDSEGIQIQEINFDLVNLEVKQNNKANVIPYDFGKQTNQIQIETIKTLVPGSIQNGILQNAANTKSADVLINVYNLDLTKNYKLTYTLKNPIVDWNFVRDINETSAQVDRLQKGVVAGKKSLADQKVSFKLSNLDPKTSYVFQVYLIGEEEEPIIESQELIPGYYINPTNQDNSVAQTGATIQTVSISNVDNKSVSRKYPYWATGWGLQKAPSQQDSEDTLPFVGKKDSSNNPLGIYGALNFITSMKYGTSNGDSGTSSSANKKPFDDADAIKAASQRSLLGSLTIKDSQGLVNFVNKNVKQIALGGQSLNFAKETSNGKLTENVFKFGWFDFSGNAQLVEAGEAFEADSDGKLEVLFKNTTLKADKVKDFLVNSTTAQSSNVKYAYAVYDVKIPGMVSLRNNQKVLYQTLTETSGLSSSSSLSDFISKSSLYNEDAKIVQVLFAVKVQGKTADGDVGNIVFATLNDFRNLSWNSNLDSQNLVSEWTDLKEFQKLTAKDTTGITLAKVSDKIKAEKTVYLANLSFYPQNIDEDGETNIAGRKTA